MKKKKKDEGTDLLSLEKDTEILWYLSLYF